MVATATVAGLTLVPALVAVAHNRIPAPGTRTWVWRRGRPSSPGLLARLAAFAQRRPALVALTATAGLLALSIPAFGFDVADADARSLPAGTEERRVYDAVERDFTAGPVDPIDVLIEALRGLEVQLETELGRINTAYQQLLAARPAGIGASVSVGVG